MSKPITDQDFDDLEEGLRQLEIADQEDCYLPVADVEIGRVLSTPKPITTRYPDIRMIKVSSLCIDTRYQRIITAKGRGNIRYIVENFDWMHFQPILVAPAPNDMFAVIDGQHRAIAALNHPEVSSVPACVVEIPPEKQAHVFAEINSHVIVVDALEIHWARLLAGDQAARNVHDCVDDAGLIVARTKPRISNKEDIERAHGHVWDVGRIHALLKVFDFSVVSDALFFVFRWEGDYPQALNSYILNTICRLLDRYDIRTEDELKFAISWFRGRMTAEDVMAAVRGRNKADRRKPEKAAWEDHVQPAWNSAEEQMTEDYDNAEA